MCNKCMPMDFGAIMSVSQKRVKVGFKYSSDYISCLVEKDTKLVAGIARCSKKDNYDIAKGEKLALGRALQQLPLSELFRYKIWQDYFNFRPHK